MSSLLHAGVDTVCDQEHAELHRRVQQKVPPSASRQLPGLRNTGRARCRLRLLEPIRKPV
jgi:hypothetical protein